MTNIAFLGAGNIAYAIAGGLVETGYPASNIVAADPVPSQLEKFAEKGIGTATSNLAAADSADVVMLCVKPDTVKEVGEVLADDSQGKLLISVAAGITTDSIAKWYQNDSIVRCMPNTPSLIKRGMTGLYARPGVTTAQKELTDQIMGAVGKTAWFDAEADLDAVTAISGSGPAYFFYVMEVMEAAALKFGLDPEVTRELILQTALGASEMALNSEHSLTQLRTNVTSKGGTTAAALDQLEQANIGEAFDKALVAARDRSIEMSEQ